MMCCKRGEESGRCIDAAWRKLLLEVLEGKKLMRGREFLVVLTVTPLHFAIVPRGIWADQLVLDPQPGYHRLRLFATLLSSLVTCHCNTYNLIISAHIFLVFLCVLWYNLNKYYIRIVVFFLWRFACSIGSPGTPQYVCRLIGPACWDVFEDRCLL